MHTSHLNERSWTANSNLHGKKWKILDSYGFLLPRPIKSRKGLINMVLYESFKVNLRKNKHNFKMKYTYLCKQQFEHYKIVIKSYLEYRDLCLSGGSGPPDPYRSWRSWLGTSGW